MKNNQRFGKLHIIILVILIFGVMLISILLGSRQKNEGVFIFYDYSNMLSENENNMGIIDRKNNKVVIFDNLGNEVSYLDTKEGCPNQIALGQDSYFLLYLWCNERDEGKIVQYDYQSNKMKECMVPNLATIASREGYLFVGNWKKRKGKMACIRTFILFITDFMQTVILLRMSLAVNLRSYFRIRQKYVWLEMLNCIIT